MDFVLEKQLIKFLCTYQPLSFCKIFIKKFLLLIQSYEDVCHFRDQNSPFVLNKNFWYKPLLLLSFSYGHFHCAKFKKTVTMDSELWRCTIFGPHLLQINFFSKNFLISLVFFTHAYLHAKNQSQILICQWNTDDLRVLKSHWLRAILPFFENLIFSKHAVFPGC